MTTKQSFKERVRARMRKTGERYTTARAHLLGTLGQDGGAVELRGHPFRRGLCRDTTAVSNALAALDTRLSPGGAPIDEVLLTGLSGGVGFLYIVFEYPDTPPLASVLTRFDTSADKFALGGLARLGFGAPSETTSDAKARRELDAALDAGRTVLCVADSSIVSGTASPGAVAGMAPTIVAVVARDGDEYVVDAGTGRVERLSREALAGARASFKPAKRRCLALSPPDEPVDALPAVHDALAACAHRYEHAPYKGYASNFGLAGMDKFVKALTNPRDKRGWPKLFPDGKLAALGLRRLYQGLEIEMTPPSAGRGVQADFLRASADATGHAPYRAAADAFDAAGRAWSEVSAFVASCDVPAVRTGCEMLDAYAELLDEQASLGDEARSAAARRAMDSPADGDASELTAEKARAIYAEVATRATQAVAAEREAHAALAGACAEVTR